MGVEILNKNKIQNQNFNRFLSSNFVFKFFTVLTVIAVLYGVILIPKENLSSALQDLSQLTITVGLGIGALIIALNVSGNNGTINLIKQTLLFMLISVLSFFLSFVDSEYIQRLYLLVGGLTQIAILVQTTVFIKKILKMIVSL